MAAEYIVSIDQSTQGTKALLFDRKGILAGRADVPHKQIVNEIGWVEHDPEEIYGNVIKAVKEVVDRTGIDRADIAAAGISNQRETAMVWERATGRPVYNAIVWQCARGASICDEIEKNAKAELIHTRTGLKLSPYFSAAKIAWVLRNVPGAKERAAKRELCCGTMDSWLVYKLTKGRVYQTDYSNASRTQLYNITELKWDEEVCGLFGIPAAALAEVVDSNGYFGETDFEGYLNAPIAIRGVLGDSHGALFGQGCFKPGMVKATYGTGSSVMMNIGSKPIFSKSVVTSLAWGMDGQIDYVLEGNINYTGAVITWLKDDVKLISSPKETEQLALAANPEDRTYLVPAFTGLGAPYWDSGATACISGITRTTQRAEIVRAGLDSIAYQITDIIETMGKDSGIPIKELRVDGGATGNRYLMQFQSDIAQIPVQAPASEELSGIGAAYTAGIAVGLYGKEQFSMGMKNTRYQPQMNSELREQKYQGWLKAVQKILTV